MKVYTQYIESCWYCPMKQYMSNDHSLFYCNHRNAPSSINGSDMRSIFNVDEHIDRVLQDCPLPEA